MWGSLQLMSIVEAYKEHTDIDAGNNNNNNNGGGLESIIIDRDTLEDDWVEKLQQESKETCLAMTNMFVRQANLQEQTSHSDESHGLAGSTQPRRLNPTAHQVSSILVGCEKFRVHKDDPRIKAICDCATNNHCLARGRVRDIAQILQSLQWMDVKDQVGIVMLCGERFLEIASQHGATTESPNYITTVLRSSVMMYPGNETVLSAYITAAEHILFDTTMRSPYENPTAYVSRCSAYDIGNFLWFMAMAKWWDEQAVNVLVERLLEHSVVESCAPSTASRILWSYVTLVSAAQAKETGNANGGGQQRHPSALLDDLFQEYGPKLLSEKLSPIDASCALYAYGKALYTRDLGIVDHLACLLNRYLRMKKKLTPQHIAEALWACARLTTMEKEADDDDDATMTTTTTVLRRSTGNTPPYTASAPYFAEQVALCNGTLTSYAISKTIWAMGKLKIYDSRLLLPLAKRAEEEASTFRANAVASTLIGLSKLKYKDTNGSRVVSSLTAQICRKEILRDSNHQVTSNVMFSLAQLRSLDEQAVVPVFKTLVGAMNKRLNEATPQAIALTLWAHSALGLPKPVQLVRRYAAETICMDNINNDDNGGMLPRSDEEILKAMMMNQKKTP